MGANDDRTGTTIAVWAALGADVREIVRLAESEARRRGHTSLEPRHLAYGLTRHREGQAAVARAGIDPLWWRDYICFVEGVNAVRLGQREGRHHRPWDPIRDEITIAWDPVITRVLEWAVDEAHDAGRDSAAPGDLLTALKLEGTYEPAGTLGRMGLSLAQARAAAGHRHPAGRPRPPAAAPARPPRGRGGPLMLLGRAFDSRTGSERGLWPRRAMELALAARGARVEAAVEIPIRVVTIQTARPIAVPRIVEWARQYYAECGVSAQVEVVDSGLGDERDARSNEVAACLAAADIIHLEGGKPERIYDATIGSPALHTLAAASGRGAVLIGASAGARIFGMGTTSDWYTGDPTEKEPALLWGWLERVVVVPHYRHAGRSPDLGEASLRDELGAFPGSIALAVPDESVALVAAGWSHAEALFGPLYVLSAPDAPVVEVPQGGRHPLPAS
jgi:cyanophycinase-like exopeptidase